MAACVFFAFLAFAGFFVFCAEAIEALSFPPPLATAGVSVVTPKKPRAAVIAISLRISVLRVCGTPYAVRMASLRGMYTAACDNHANPEGACAILSLGPRY